MTAKRLIALILVSLLMIFGIACVAEANQTYEALRSADLSQNEPLPGTGLIAYMAVTSTAAILGFVGALFFLVASLLLAALLYRIKGRLRLIPAGILLAGWIVIFLV